MRAPATPTAYVLWFGPTGLTLARSIGRQGVPVVGLHHTVEEPCTGSRYARVQVLPPIAKDPQAWVDWLVAEGRRQPQRGVLLPAFDPGWQLIATHREALTPYFAMSLPEGGDPLRWLGKPAQYAAARSVGIDTPATFVPRHADELPEIARHVTLPCILKPVASVATWRSRTAKVLYVCTRRELIDRTAQVLAEGVPVMIQELIPGGDEQIITWYSYIDSQGRTLAGCVSRKLHQYAPLFGSSCLSISDHDPAVQERAQRLLAAMRFRGISSVEFKRDPRDGRLVLMEVNLRAPLKLATALDSGVNIPYAAYRDLCGQPVEPVIGARRRSRRVGLLEQDYHSWRLYRAACGTGRWTWWRAWVGHSRDLHFAWDDLRPFVRSLRQTWWRLRRGSLNPTAGQIRELREAAAACGLTVRAAAPTPVRSALRVLVPKPVRQTVREPQRRFAAREAE